jgi:NAD+ synthase
MKPQRRIEKITKWIGDYARKNNINTLVVGISGGIDSSVVSALCGRTGIATIAVSMPIRQSKTTHELSLKHGEWLEQNFANVSHETVDLTSPFKHFEKAMDTFSNELAFANSRARLRMMCLYQIAQSQGGIVVGTGNRVEDFGVGFFTKYGDGGVDLSPIGDCMKSDVWEMGGYLNILPEIISAAPTDGLWADGRTDEDQLGMTYPDLGVAMQEDESKIRLSESVNAENLKTYRSIRQRNLHKMQPIPVCKF